MKFGISLFFLFIANCVLGQSGTEIYLFDLKLEDGIIGIENPLNITNQSGYDNQPSFYDKGKKLLFTSMSNDQQTEIFSYNIKSGKISRITNSETSEYSPIAFAEDKYFSCISAEKNGDQRLWQYDFKGKRGKAIFENLKFVGYHSWIDDFRLALFIVGEPNTLKIANKTSNNALFVTDYIGRCILKMPGKESIIFVDKKDTVQWTINSLDPNKMETKTIIDTMKGREDFCIMDDGTILMGDGKSLYKFNPMLDIGWTKVANLADYGIKNEFTRLAVNQTSTKIAIVVNE